MEVIPEQCTGCRICEMICSITHSEKINTQRSRIRIESVWPEEENIYVCRKCNKPNCVKKCPQDALTQNASGIIEIDEDKCILCKTCIEACPFDAIFIGKEGNLLICDGCDGDYECVSWCPNDVLEVKKEAVKRE